MRLGHSVGARLEGSRTLTTRPIGELDGILDRHEQAGLRRALTLWLTQDFLPSRFPGVTVPEVKEFEEVEPMIAENAIDWTIPMKEEARREGEAEGLRKGEAALLLRLLTRRFGALSPAVEERVRGADADQLLEWGERFVDATSLDEVFDGNR